MIPVIAFPVIRTLAKRPPHQFVETAISPSVEFAYIVSPPSFGVQ